MTMPENLKTSTPVRAVVGAGDLVVEKLRGAREDAQQRLSHVHVEPKKWQEDAQRLQSDVQTAASQRVAKLSAEVKSVPTRAQSVVNDLVSQAGSTYDDLAARGRHVLEGAEHETAQQGPATTTAAAGKSSTTSSSAPKSAKSSTTRKTSSTARKSTKKATDTSGA